jgi:hypothetical protein
VSHKWEMVIQSGDGPSRPTGHKNPLRGTSTLRGTSSAEEEKVSAAVRAALVKRELTCLPPSRHLAWHGVDDSRGASSSLTFIRRAGDGMTGGGTTWGDAPSIKRVKGAVRRLCENSATGPGCCSWRSSTGTTNVDVVAGRRPAA